MTRLSTPFGEPLSDHSKRLVEGVRSRLQEPIHSVFDSDFNVYRFIMNVERTHKKDKDIVELAAKALDNHLRIRRAFKLDTDPVKTFDENPVFTERFMPRGDIQVDKWDKQNRLLWFIDYASVTVETLAHCEKSSNSVKFQFWQFEYMLRLVMEHERKTGRLSGLRHIIDMGGYEINPFTMLFVSSGTLAYYSQLFHYENYPELVSPGEMVRIARWIWLPYKLVKPVMPGGFTDRFTLHDSNFLDTIKQDIDLKDIPVSLGGTNTEIKCVPAVKRPEEDYWKITNPSVVHALETIQVPARKKRAVKLNVSEAGKKVKWYFHTDGDVYFGVFYREGADNDENEKECDTESMEMVYPYWKLTAKLVHEFDELICEKAGRYYIVFGNEHSWLSKRSVDLIVHIEKDGEMKRVHADGSLSPATVSF